MALRRIPWTITRRGADTRGWRPSLHEAAISHPFLDELSHLIGVGVHHQHVAVTPDAFVGQRDPVGRAANVVERLVIVLRGLNKFGPKLALVHVVAPHYKVWHVL